MLAEELLVFDAASPLWNAARPLLDAALRIEQYDEGFTWHGWNKAQISSFLENLPPQCCLIVGVWASTSEEDAFEREDLALGIVCEIVAGEVASLRTFEALAAFGLKPAEQLEPGVDDALEIIRVVGTRIAPVAYALFTDKVTWDEWLFACDDEGSIADKREILTALALQGHCVIMGEQTVHRHLL